ncbi:putative gibberellin 20 oxidase [Daldinia caldariorum]|uniref:putative gibberellin 20 oxidase n=1 Tax=Daldinia caldariorum TaxID=326644 RepID=UPI0020079557|nr:putative gibberellin 20 oxidase [Daldinia caldariorum]KAI1469127.1 putative gibberellin 20 oxidase [Daldinia caldariorum]
MAIDHSSKFVIPVIDISGYLAGNDLRTAAITNELNAACRSPGFFQIVGHDIPAELRAHLFNKVVQFYDLPTAKKSALSHTLSVNGARGYEAVGTVTLEGDYVDQKEGFMIGTEKPPGRFLHGPNLWPEESDCPGFRSTMEEYFASMRSLSVKMFRLLALSLGLDEYYFDAFVNSPDSISMCRAHRYPRDTAESVERSRGTGAHTDFGAMTLLLQDDVGGLEVFHRPSNTWHPVSYVEDAFIVNIGDMIERWTNGRYMSTLHRVITPISSKDRYSVVLFNEGLLDQVIECIPTCIEAGEIPIHEPITAEAHLRRRYETMYGEADDGGNNK